jgi:hypothetical protein
VNRVFGVRGGVSARSISAGGGRAVYWPGWDVARKVVMVTTALAGTARRLGRRACLGIRPHRQTRRSPPLAARDSPHGAIIRHHSGYVLDGYGSLHTFASPPVVAGDADLIPTGMAGTSRGHLAPSASTQRGIGCWTAGGLHPVGVRLTGEFPQPRRRHPQHLEALSRAARLLPLVSKVAARSR